MHSASRWGVRVEANRLSSCGAAAGAPDRLARMDTIVVREWEAEKFHQRVLELESQGYHAKRDTYRILAEMDPGSGKIVHLHTMEMVRQQPAKSAS